MYLTNILLKKVKSKNVMVLLESVVSGHKYIQIRERLAEKMEVIMFDPYSEYLARWTLRILVSGEVTEQQLKHFLTHLFQEPSDSWLSVLHSWAVFLQMFHRANHVANNYYHDFKCILIDKLLLIIMNRFQLLAAIYEGVKSGRLDVPTPQTKIQPK